MEISFHLKHGSTKYDITTKTDTTLLNLMGQIEELSGVPVGGQKLIVNGRSLTSMDHEKSLSDCRISPGCKVMLLGKRHDPASDQLYQKLVGVEEKTNEEHKKLIQIAKEFRDVEKGFLAKEHQEEKLKGLLKQCRSCSESFMRSLEALDDLRFEENQLLAKNKRKTVATNTNKHLDHADEVIRRIENQLSSAKKWNCQSIYK